MWGEALNRKAAGMISEKELKYERLWKVFFESITIKERENPKCQQNHLPLRCREGMPEMTDPPLA